MSPSYRYLIWFLIIISVLIFAVITIRLVHQYQNRSFKGENFSVLYVGGDKLYYLSFEENENVVIAADHIWNKEKSLAKLSLEMGLPIRGVVVDNKSGGIDFGADFFSLSDVVDGLMGNRFDFYKLNSADLVRFYRLGKSNEIQRYENIEDEARIRNEALFNRAESIEVVNSTEKSGLAGSIANMLSAYGFSVVTTSTSFDEAENTRLYVNRPVNSETIHALEDVFETKALSDGNVSNVADVVIVLGEDIL